MAASLDTAPPPAGFAPLRLKPSGFLQGIGPFWGRREGDRLTIGLRIEPRHCNSAGLAHGGLLLSIVDVVLTVGTNFNADISRFLPTVHVDCDFVRGVPLGAWVQGNADVVRVTSGHAFSQLVLADEAGQVFLRASGILLVRGEPDPTFGRDNVFAPASSS
jgi:uncharacterized protein (TIGR00369 family)